MSEFQRILFGRSSAEAESTDYPELLLAGYLDHWGIIEQIRDGGRFLVLGYKGSGKSAIASHLSLRSESDPALFVTHTFLSDFPHTTFLKMVEGVDDPQTRFPSAWSWILMLALLSSFMKDEGCQSARDIEFNRVLDVFRKQGLLPAVNLRDIALRSSKKSFKISIPSIIETAFEKEVQQGWDVQFYQLVENLKTLVSSFNSGNQHLIIIDGLDDVLTGRQTQYDSLAALLIEVARLNHLLKKSNINAKLVLLCRTELYERIPGPNKNKLRQDYAIDLDWYHDTRRPGTSRLVELANLRASLSLERKGYDVFGNHFPAEIDGSTAVQFLLNNTRHTPRDFIQLLNYVQKYAKVEKLSRETVLSGLRDYSINYFLPEVRDELVGYIPSTEVDTCLKLIGALRKRDFTYSELEEELNRSRKYHDINDLEVLLEELFACSAVGNIDRRPSGINHFSFRYRNRNATLDLDGRIILHKGLWKALNVV